MDPDYEGAKMRNGNGHMNFVDEDGDGINDNMQNRNRMNNQKGMMMRNQGMNRMHSQDGSQSGKVGNGQERQRGMKMNRMNNQNQNAQGK